MVPELDPVMVEPASVDDTDSVKGGDGRLGEESGQDVSDDTADGVYGENVECVVIRE